MEEKIIQLIKSSIVKNPSDWFKIYQMASTYNQHHMQDTQSVGDMIDSLSTIFNIKLPKKERSSIISWLIEKQIDPRSIRKFCTAFLQAYLSQQEN